MTSLAARIAVNILNKKKTEANNILESFRPSKNKLPDEIELQSMGASLNDFRKDQEEILNKYKNPPRPFYFSLPDKFKNKNVLFLEEQIKLFTEFHADKFTLFDSGQFYAYI